MEEDLTPEETAIFHTGKCPDCGRQLYKGSSLGLAILVRCKKKHLFFVHPPGTPERLYQKEVVK